MFSSGRSSRRDDRPPGRSSQWSHIIRNARRDDRTGGPCPHAVSPGRSPWRPHLNEVSPGRSPWRPLSSGCLARTIVPVTTSQAGLARTIVTAAIPWSLTWTIVMAAPFNDCQAAMIVQQDDRPAGAIVHQNDRPGGPISSGELARTIAPLAGTIALAARIFRLSRQDDRPGDHLSSRPRQDDRPGSPSKEPRMGDRPSGPSQ